MPRHNNRNRSHRRTHTPSVISALIKAVLVVGLFGLFPGGWLIELPIIVGYASYKAILHRDFLKRWIRRHFQHAVRSIFPRNDDIEQSFQERLGQGIGNFIKNTWFKIVKGLMAFVLLFTLPVPWSFLALYGLYRYQDRQLKKLLLKNISYWYDLIVGIFQGTTGALSFKQVLRNIVICSLLLAGGIYFSGELFLLDLSLTILQSMIVWIGVTGAWRDFRRAFNTPLQMLSNNVGKLLGAFFGRYFAYNFMTGRVVGSLGPAVGQVQSTGLLSEILSPLFNPSGLRFSNMSLFGRLLSSDFAHFVNNVFTNVFFTHNMQLHGDFYGVIGPTHFQIFLLMGVGCLIGYAIERLVSACYEGVVNDARVLRQRFFSSRSAHDFSHKARVRKSPIAMPLTKNRTLLYSARRTHQAAAVTTAPQKTTPAKRLARGKMIFT